MSDRHTPSSTQSDPGLELVRLLSVSPHNNEGPYTAGLLDTPAFRIFRKEDPLDQEPTLPKTPSRSVKMRFDNEVANGDGDDSPVTNPYAMVGEAEEQSASSSSSPLQESHDIPSDPFIDIVDAHGEYRGSIPNTDEAYATYGNLATPAYANGAGVNGHVNGYAQPHIAPPIVNGPQFNFNAAVNGVPAHVNGASPAVNGTSMNITPDMGYNMGTNSVPNGQFIVLPYPNTSVNLNHSVSATPEMNYVNHVNGINNTNGVGLGRTRGSNNGGYQGTFGHRNRNSLHVGAANNFHRGSFQTADVPTQMELGGQTNGTMVAYPHPQMHANGHSNAPVAVNAYVNAPVEGNGWDAQAPPNGQLRGYQDPFTLRAHMAPNPLEQARNELQTLNQRLYRINQELERAVQAFRSHINESSNEVQRMNQMASRLGDSTQVPAVRRGLELLSSDIRHRLNQGRATTFVNDGQIFVARERNNGNPRRSSRGHHYPSN